MEIRIKGGKKNNNATVDVDGDLHTLALSEEPIGRKSWQGEAFTVLAEVNLSGSLTESILYLQNKRTGKDEGRVQALAIHDWIISSDSNVHVEIYLDGRLVSGGGAKTPIMMYRSKAPPGENEVIIKDSILTPIVDDITDADEIRSLFIGGYVEPHMEKFDGALLLPAEGTLIIHATGAVGNKVRVSLSAYWTTQAEL